MLKFSNKKFLKEQNFVKENQEYFGTYRKILWRKIKNILEYIGIILSFWDGNFKINSIHICWKCPCITVYHLPPKQNTQKKGEIFIVGRVSKMKWEID
jgi:hypothetical protein